jgi:PAS domain S-box-containing protein
MRRRGTSGAITANGVMSSRSKSNDRDRSANADDASARASFASESGSAILWFDAEDHPIAANRQAALIHGFPSVDAMLHHGWKALDFVAQEDRGHAIDLFEKLRSQASSHSEGIRLRRMDDTSVVADVEAMLMLDGQGGANGFVVVARDTAERTRAHDEQLRLQKLQSIKLLAGGIAHDFNNVLTGILGNIELARLNAVDFEPVLQRLNEAEAAVRRAGVWTEQLQTLSERSRLDDRHVDMALLLRETVPLALHGSSVGFELEVDDDLPKVRADEALLVQVIHNLSRNSVQAMGEGGTIWVRCRKTEEAGEAWVEVVIRDTGEGIAAEDLTRVFDPYFSTRSKGRGLGLAMSDAIIRRHGGRLELESQAGQGTEVRFRLSARESAPPRQARSAERPPQQVRQGHRILVMDDDSIVLDVVATMLEQLGYRTTCTTNGEDAIAAYRRAMVDSDEYAIVMVDLTIQDGMGGAETVERLREIDPHVRAVVSSGYPDDPIVTHPHEHGFAQAIVKPFSVRELQEALEKVTPSD